MASNMYVTTVNFNYNYEFIHTDNIELVTLIVYKFYIGNNTTFYNLIYDCNTRLTEIRNDYEEDKYIVLNEIICIFVNKILEFEKFYILRDRDEYLIELLYFINQTVFQNDNYSVDDLNTLFYDLDLTDFLDEISATFFKLKSRIFIENRKSSPKS